MFIKRKARQEESVELDNFEAKQCTIAPKELRKPLLTRRMFFCWLFWVLLCVLNLICLCPFIYGTPLWVAHLSLHMNKATETSWMMNMEEGLKLISYFSKDLGEYSHSEYETNYGLMNRNVYNFDIYGWCRIGPDAGKAVCYRGAGLDVLYGFVTDLGTQIGGIGNVEDPEEFGRSLANTYKSTVNDLDEVYLSARKANSSNLDMEKLQLIHGLKLSQTFGTVMVILRIAHTLCVIVISMLILAQLWVSEWSRFLSFRERWVPITILIALLVCELTTFATLAGETAFVNVLDSVLLDYGATFSTGLGYIFLIVEFILGIAFAVTTLLK